MARPAARRPLLRLLRLVLVTGLVVVALVLLAFYAFQRRLIYFPQPIAGAVPAGAGELVEFASADGTRITGLYAKPAGPASPVALIAHGNAGNVVTWRPILDPFVARGFGALLLDPRGYGKSDGSPSEEGCLADAEAAVKWLGERGIDASRLVVVGASIGTGLAVPIAARHEVRALILESPFTSLPDVACEHYPFLPCRWLLRDRYDNVAAASRVRCPVLILHGTDDEIVPVAQAERLARSFPSPATLRLAPGVDHNGLMEWPGYDAALAAFLATLP